MYCTECGASIADTAKFCTECGHPIRRSAAAAQESGTEPVFQAAFESPGNNMQTEAVPTADEPKAEPTVSAAFEANFDGAPTAPTAPVRPPRKYRGRLVFAVLATIFLFVPTGVISIVQAVKAMQHADAGETAAALRAARCSTLFAILSIVCNVVWHGIGLVLLIKKYM